MKYIARIPLFVAVQIVVALVAITAAFAYPFIAPNPESHVNQPISDSSGNLSGANGVRLADTLNLPCPGNNNTAATTCFVAPNDGHTYTIVAWDVQQQTTGVGTCSFNIGVAPSGSLTPIAAATPVACSTPGTLNATIGFAATPTTGAGTPSPTPIIIQNGNVVIYNPSFSATTTPIAANGTLSIQRQS